MLSEFGIILLAIIMALVAVIAILGIAKFLRPHKPNEEKLTTYESGEAPIGNAQVQFNTKFYIVALIFILFDVELIFLFPWATIFGNKQIILESKGIWGWFALVEMVIFILVLALGLAYVWAKGHLSWVIGEDSKKPNFDPVVPKNLYQQVNNKYSKS